MAKAPEQFEPFGHELRKKEGRPGDIAARMREARHGAGSDQIGTDRHHDGDGLRRTQRAKDAGGVDDEDFDVRSIRSCNRPGIWPSSPSVDRYSI